MNRPHLSAVPVGPRPSRLPSLTGLRFVAALSVFAFHTSIEAPFRDARISADVTWLFSKAGWTGVGFFFILSGFVLTWTARQGDSPRSFWRRRAAKVYPNHVVTWAAAALLMLWAGQKLTVGIAVPNLLLLHPWLPTPNIFSMNDVSWSLGCEALFYLLFPLLHRVVLRIRPERLWLCATGTAAAVMTMPAVASLLPARPLLHGVPLWRLWFVYAFPPVRLLDFLLGILMARIVMTGRWIPLGLRWAFPISAGGYLAALYVPELYGFVAATVVPLALLIAAAATSDMKGTRSPFRGRTMVRLGELSFAFYMVHRLLQSYGHRALGAGRAWDTGPALGLLVASFAVSLLLAWLLYTVVERPLMRRLSHSRKHPAHRAGSPGAAVQPKEDTPRTSAPHDQPIPERT